MSSSSGIVPSVISRLGETSLPERDCSSFKTNARCLSDSSSRNLGKLLLVSPRRDVLAYARIPILTTIHACNSQTFETKQHLSLFQTTTTTHKHHKHETKLKIGSYEENTKIIASLT